MFKKIFRKLHGIKSKGKMLVYKYTENGVGKTQKKTNIFLYNCFVYTEILTTMCFTCLLSSGLVQLMCMASFIFNLKTELSLSMI